MKKLPTLNDFLNLSIDHATDTYLRELALVAIESRHSTHTVESISVYQRILTEVAVPKEKIIESRYLVASDGTVTDQQTKLMWMQFPLADTFTFKAAQEAAKNFNTKKSFSGYADWRMPSREELLSLIVEGNYPSICQEAFPDTPAAWFWTSMPHTVNAADAWAIYFGYGRIYSSDQSCFNHVRLVR